MKIKPVYYPGTVMPANTGKSFTDWTFTYILNNETIESKVILKSCGEAKTAMRNFIKEQNKKEQ